MRFEDIMSTSTAKPRKRKSKKPSDFNANIDAIFDRIDLNHDGRISSVELTKAAQYLGFNPTKKEAEEMIQECNPSQKGYVNRAEFRKLFADKQAEMDAQVEEITKAFKVFDRDNSGTISRDEIRNVLKACGEDIDEDELQSMIQKIDTDGNGIISIEEFAMVMCDVTWE